MKLSPSSVKITVAVTLINGLSTSTSTTADDARLLLR